MFPFICPFFLTVLSRLCVSDQLLWTDTHPRVCWPWRSQNMEEVSAFSLMSFNTKERRFKLGNDVFNWSKLPGLCCCDTQSTNTFLTSSPLPPPTFQTLQENFHPHDFPHFLFLVGMFKRRKRRRTWGVIAAGFTLKITPAYASCLRRNVWKRWSWQEDISPPLHSYHPSQILPQTWNEILPFGSPECFLEESFWQIQICNHCFILTF